MPPRVHPSSNSHHIACTIDGCTRWFKSLAGLRRHTQSQYHHSSTSGLQFESESAPSPPLAQFHNPSPHPSPRYHNPVSSPPPCTPSPMDVDSPPHPHIPNPNDYCDMPLNPFTPSMANFSEPSLSHSSNPLSCHHPPAFFNPSYYEAFDDGGYHSDDKENEEINSSDLPSPPRSLLYNDGISNENIAALIRRYHHLLNGVQSSHHFTFFLSNYKQVHHATEMEIRSPRVHLHHLQTMIQVPTTGLHMKIVYSSKLRSFYSPGSKCLPLTLIFYLSCGVLHWQSMTMFLPSHHTKTCMRKSTQHI